MTDSGELGSGRDRSRAGGAAHRRDSVRFPGADHRRRGHVERLRHGGQHAGKTRQGVLAAGF